MPEIDLEPDEYRPTDEEPEPQTPLADTRFDKWILLLLVSVIIAWFKAKT
jgi:hypothetical protein